MTLIESMVPTMARSSKLSELMTLRQVSERLAVKEVTLRSWRFRGYGPPSFKIGASVVYHRADVEAWVRDQEEQTA